MRANLRLYCRNGKFVAGQEPPRHMGTITFLMEDADTLLAVPFLEMTPPSFERWTLFYPRLTYVGLAGLTFEGVEETETGRHFQRWGLTNITAEE